MLNFLSIRAWIIFLGSEAILAGVLWMIGLLSPVLLIVLGGILLAGLWTWDRGREPLARLIMRVASKLHPNILSSGNVFHSAVITQTDPPPFSPALVYVGQILIGDGHLEEKRTIELSIRGFNGSGNSIFFLKVDGKIVIEEMPVGTSRPICELPLPWLSDQMKLEKIEHGEEFNLILEQRLTEDIAVRFKELGETPAIGFDLDGLNVLMASHRWPNKLERLKLWNGVRIARNAKQLHLGRIMKMRTHEKLTAIEKMNPPATYNITGGAAPTLQSLPDTAKEKQR